MNTFRSKAELDHWVLYQLMQHVGAANAVLRAELVRAVFDVDLVRHDVQRDPLDRQVRESIERMRHQGALVCNLGSGDGYFMAATLEEYQAFRAMYGSHAFPILDAIREMDRAAEQQWDASPLQPRMI